MCLKVQIWGGFPLLGQIAVTKQKLKWLTGYLKIAFVTLQRLGVSLVFLFKWLILLF